jgi:hypothetical protein
VIYTVIGGLIVAIILLEAFETIILPRRVTRRFRLTRLFYVSTWRPWRAFAHLLNGKTRENFISFYGPASLLFLFGAWASALIVGFGFLFFAAATKDPTHPPLETCFYLSGTTFFTLGLGDVTPHTSAERVMAVFESGLGLGFLALIISYLPVIYQAFSRREVSIVLLDARAGSPPTAAELLSRHGGQHGVQAIQELFQDWERWSAELLESHISYPVVAYFRSQHSNESWLAALTAILDTTALIVATSDTPCSRQAKLTFAMCRHTIVDLSQVFHAQPRSDDPDRLPAADLARLRASLDKCGYQLREDDASTEKLHELRRMYEPYLHALARYLFVTLPPWILEKKITDNWKTSAWGKISGIASHSSTAAYADDHF